MDWHVVFDSIENPSDVFKSFYIKLSSVIDVHIPLKRLSRKEIRLKSKPWISKGLNKSIQIKNKLYKKYIKSKSSFYHAKFKLYRNKLNHLLKIRKKQYYNNYFLDCAGDGKMIWKGIKQIVHCKPPISQRSIKLVENENEISHPKEIANKFNDYFANIGKSIASEIPIACKDPIAYLGNPVCNSFYLFPTWSGEIETEINNLKSGKSSGPSSIPVNILKLTQHVVSKPLEIIFNASFASGVVPNDFKLANVIPVFKKGSQYSLCNYRPISLLSVFNKLLEKLIYNRLINFIDKK